MAQRAKASLADLMRTSRSGLVSVEDAARELGLSAPAASAHLTRLVKTGWAQRVRRGLYLILPLDATPDRPATPEDPWVLANELFSPCYIGGWSAAEHWGLTEQLFRSTLVATAAQVRNTHSVFAGNAFRLYAVKREHLTTGIATVWRGSHRIAVSGPERTIVDGLNKPDLTGGLRHLVQIMVAYADSDRHDFATLVDVAEASATGAAWKRLGYIAELLWPAADVITAAAATHLSAGYSRLDPAVKRNGRLTKRWRVWVNVDLAGIVRGRGAR